MTLILDDEAVRRLFTVEDALLSADRAFRALANEQAEMPQRLAMSIPAHDGTHLSMPCYLHDAQGEVLTVKVASVFAQNRVRFGKPVTLAFLALQDPKSGELLALMDAEFLTAMRTAAASTLAAKLLGPQRIEAMALFGAGGQASAHLEVILALFPLKRVFVLSRTEESRRGLCDRVKTAVELIPTADATSALREARLVCLTTNSQEPVFRGEDVQPGTLVTAVGSFRPEMREFDFDLVARSRVYVDHLPAAQRNAGELIQAVEKGVWSWDKLAGELGEVLTGAVVGGYAADRVTIFKSVGLAVQDAAAAAAVFARAVQ